MCMMVKMAVMFCVGSVEVLSYLCRDLLFFGYLSFSRWDFVWALDRIYVLVIPYCIVNGVQQSKYNVVYIIVYERSLDEEDNKLPQS